MQVWAGFGLVEGFDERIVGSQRLRLRQACLALLQVLQQRVQLVGRTRTHGQLGQLCHR